MHSDMTLNEVSSQFHTWAISLWHVPERVGDEVEEKRADV